MEQRRIILFLSLSFAVLVLNSIFLAPPPQPEVDGEAKNKQVDAVPLADEGDQPHVEPEISATVKDKASAAEEAVLEPQDAEQAEVPLAFVTLGSVDPADPYRQLWTFTNLGAGVRRVELASPRYRDLHDRGGYLGQLELLHEDGQEGLLVRVVGAGTPAHAAGIKVGDRLLEMELAGKREVFKDVQQFHTLLERTRPNRKIKLVLRSEQGERSEKEVVLGRRPLEVMRPEAENILLREDTLPPDYEEAASFRFTFTEIGTDKSANPSDELQGVELLDSNWIIVSHDSSGVSFRQTVPAKQLEVLKHFRIEQIPDNQLQSEDYPAYSVTMEIEVRNLSSAGQEFVYRLDGPNGLPIEGWWYARKSGREWGAAGLRDVVGRYFGGDTAEVSPATIAKDESANFEGGSMAFMGVDAQYFAAMLLPHKMSPDEVWLDYVQPVIVGPGPRARSGEEMYANTSCRMISQEQSVPAGTSLKHVYTVFAGPKRPDLLANYHSVDSEQYTLHDLLYYGWFSGIAKAMLWILHFFYSIVGNYGIAIIMLTVLVRSCMVPITRKQMQSMARMQQLKPELEKIKVKYKSDPQKQSQAMQELYRKHNINPLAGCLPMFIQLPIFVGLYRSLAVDVELRQAPLISSSIRWCSNLAAPDMFYDWSSFMPEFVNQGLGFFGFGPYLNLLPLATAGLFIVQQKITMPPPADEQAALQQKMMQYMMIFFSLMFYKVASGLCVYFIASSLWGLAERKLWPVPALAAPEGATVSDAKHSGRSLANGEPNASTRRPKKKR